MKFRAKTTSKNLGKLMKNGGTAPAHHTTHNQNNDTIAEYTAENREARIGEELAQLDTESFERLLQDAATLKTNLLKKDSTGGDPALVSIMGLIDEGKDRRLNTTTEHNDTITTKPPAEEIVTEKPSPAMTKTMPQFINMKSPICGNPVTDFDKMNDSDNDTIAVTNQDMVSRMEMGESQQLFTQEKNADVLDMEKFDKSQKNIKCDEPEQLQYLKLKGLQEFEKFDNILGPASRGEFASFNQNMTPAISSELGVINPLNTFNFNTLQTCTPNGRLLPAVPRKFFSPIDSSPVVRSRPPPQKGPYTFMLHTVSNILNVNENSNRNIHSSLSSISPQSVSRSGHIESASQKKRNKLKAKRAAAAAVPTGGNEGINSNVEDDGKEDLLDEEEKENIDDDGLTEEELEARRNKNRKDRNKKKARKEAKAAEEAKVVEAEELRKKQEAEVSPNSVRGNQISGRSSVGIGSTSQDESQKNHQNGGRRSNGAGAGAKNDNNEGNTPANLGSGIIEELTENPGKKHKKGNNSNNGSKKNNKQQQNQKKEQHQKEVARSPPSDNESISIDSEAEKSKKPLQEGGKKMDEGAVAASITKRCSSGVGQQSEEDDDQSYVSAQENLGGSNSRLSTPPTEFADARQSRDEVIDNVMLDPNNYRDDEDVDSLAKQLQQEEDEFITVGKSKKKNKKQSSVQENVSASSTASSSSPPNRRSAQPDTRATSTTNSIPASPASGNNQPQHHQNQRGNNRPVAHPTTLGDFMETTKKETHKNVKHKKTSPSTSTVPQKKQPSFEEPTPSSPTFVDALEAPISINTAPAFSYADAAKKTSGENTPTHEMSPVPLSTNTNSATTSTMDQSPSSHPQTREPSKQSKSGEPLPPRASPVSTKKFVATASSAVQLPPSSAVAATFDISFGYEETPEDKQKLQQKETKVVTPPPQKPQKPTRMNGVDLLKSFTQVDEDGTKKEDNLQKMPENGSREANVLANERIALWETRWDVYTNTGIKPILYKPSQKK